MRLRRVAVLAFLILAAAAGVSAWLVIDARSDEPDVVVESRPQQEEDDQQQAQAAQPEPSEPEQATQESQQAAQADKTDQAQSADEEAVEEEDPEPEDGEQSGEEAEPAPSEPAEPEAETETLDADSPARDLLIAALDVPRGPLPNPPTFMATYVVAEEDSLSSIAEALGVSVDELIAANDLDDPDAITVGQVLSAPGDRPSESGYIALEVPPSLTDDGVVYGTITDLDYDTIHSAVATRAEPLMLVSACIDGLLRVYVQHLDSLGHEGGITALTRVYWSVDDGPLRTSQWKQSGSALESINPRILFEELQEAETLWWRTHLLEAEFPVASMFPTDVQANLINCGR